MLKPITKALPPKLNLLAGILFLSACTSTADHQAEDSKPGIDTLSPLSVTLAGFNLQKNDQIAWLPEAIGFYRDPRINKTGIKQMIESAIVQEARNRGYSVLPYTASADYFVAYTAAMESSLDDRTILLRYGLLPGDNMSLPAGSDYSRGSLIIYLVDATSRQPVWKSALQANVDFDADSATRESRVQRAVKKMLSTLPVEK